MDPFNASVGHISMSLRPYGPRMHLDEDAASANPVGGVALAIPADIGENLSEYEAAAAYMAATAPKKKPEPAGAADPAAADPDNELPDLGDADPAEEPLISEDEEADPAAKPLIARPKSWTEAEDAEWQSTPRALQEKIVARELERDTALRRTQNEAADKLKGLTAKEHAAEHARQQYEAKLPALMQALHNTNNTAFSDIKSQDDADLLAQVDPARWVQWKAHQDRMQQTNHELLQAEGKKAAQTQTEWQNLRNSEDALASEKIPDLADPEKGPKLMKRAIARLGELGIDGDRLNDLASGKERLPIFNHVIQQLLNDSIALHDLRAASKKAVAVAKDVPPVQRPGSAKPSGAAATDRVQALETRLNNSGDIKDAAALYMAQQSAARRRA